MQTPADIQDSAQLRLLGDILQPDMNVSAIGALRLRLMQPGFSWQALVELALGQGVLLPLIFALTKRSLLPPIPRSIKFEKHVSVQLQSVYALHLAYRQQERRQLEDILQVLKRARIAPLILKGGGTIWSSPLGLGASRVRWVTSIFSSSLATSRALRQR